MSSAERKLYENKHILRCKYFKTYSSHLIVSTGDFRFSVGVIPHDQECDMSDDNAGVKKEIKEREGRVIAGVEEDDNGDDGGDA